jgi:hypothetical protein
MMTTTRKKLARFVAALGLATTMAACGANSNNNATDLAMPTGGDGGGGDMATETCVMNPMTPIELLNACTTAQTGDPTKDAPYHPSLAPNGNLPPLP